MQATFPWVVTWVALPPCVCSAILLTMVRRSRPDAALRPIPWWRRLRPRFGLGTLCCVSLALCAALAIARERLGDDLPSGIAAATFWFFSLLPLLQLFGLVANDVLSPPARSRLSTLQPLFLPTSNLRAVPDAEAGEIREFNPCQRPRRRVC